MERIKAHPFLKLCFSILFLFCALDCSSQNENNGQLLAQLSSATTDSARVKILFDISLNQGMQDKQDSAIWYAKRALELSERAGLNKKVVEIQTQLAFLYNLKGNYPQALNYSLRVLKLAERTKDSSTMPNILVNIGSLYSDLNDYRNAIQYSKQALSIAMRFDDSFKSCFCNLAIGYYFNDLKEPDSALPYLQQAYLIAKKPIRDNEAMQAWALAELGKTNELQHNFEIATSYYRKSLLCDSSVLTYYMFVPFINYKGLSDIFKSKNLSDSAIYYSKKALIAATKSYQSPKILLMAYKNLAELYAGIDNKQSIYYYQLESSLRDSILNNKQLNEVQNITLQEEERQAEIAKLEKETAEQMKLRIEYAFIAIGILCFIIIFLLLSRSIVVNEKLISFLGVIALLVVFEFINLIIHPFLGKITHHSPSLMLAAMVLIAALLVPAHHKIEKWVLARVIEKNKRIRLATAKKIIEEHESEQRLRSLSTENNDQGTGS